MLIQKQYDKLISWGILFSDGKATMCIILEKVKETILDFSNRDY